MMHEKVDLFLELQNMPMTKSPNMSLRKSDRPGIFAMDVDHKELRAFIYKVIDKLIDLKFDHKVRNVDEVAHGGHGQVLDVKYQRQPYVLKIPRNMKEEDIYGRSKQFVREVLTAIHIEGHPACTITSFWGVLLDQGKSTMKTFGIVMPKMQGSLCCYEKGEPIRALGATDRTIIAYGMAATMGDLHRIGIMHRDFKPQNVLVDKRGYPYLCDFGGVKVARAVTNSLASQQGTGPFAHPKWRSYLSSRENRKECYCQGYDVYAYGLFYMYLCVNCFEDGRFPENCGKEEWDKLKPYMKSFYDKLIYYPYDDRNEFLKICDKFVQDEEQRDFVVTMCCDDPKDSLSFEQIAEKIRTERNYWFKGTDENKFKEYVAFLDQARADFHVPQR